MILKDKTIIITGASRGIGRGIARVCAREGAAIGLNFYTNEDGASELARELKRDFGVRVYLLPFDVSDFAQLSVACEKLIHSGVKIQGWVNNAGINKQGIFLTQSAEDIEAQLDVNIKGPLNAARFILPHMMENREGSILNIGSITRFHVSRGQAVYAATKGALASLSLALAQEYGKKGVRVNCIEPGPVKTDMLEPTRRLAEAEIKKKIPLRRLGEPEDIAELAAFLLSERATFITGGLYNVDGGYSLG